MTPRESPARSCHAYRSRWNGTAPGDPGNRARDFTTATRRAVSFTAAVGQSVTSPMTVPFHPEDMRLVITPDDLKETHTCGFLTKLPHTINREPVTIVANLGAL